MKQTSLSVRKVGGYVVVISLLLLGSVFAVWQALSTQLEQQATDTVRYVSSLGPGLADISSTETSIGHSTIAQDAGQSIVTIDNLSAPLINWIEQERAPNLEQPGLLDNLKGILGLPLLNIDSLKILDGTIGMTDLDNTVNGLLGLAGTVLDDSITSAKILNSSITTLDIDDKAITSDLLAPGAVGALELADNSVTGVKIFDGAITTADVATDAVTSSLIANDAVTSTKILDGVIVANDIAADAISGNHILDGAIDAVDIAVESITSGLILNGAISTNDIAVNAVTGALIADGTIGPADISDGAIGALQLAGDAITSAKILDGTIESGDVATGAIGASQLANGSVQTGKLSTASNKKTVSIQIGDIAIVAGDTERPVFIAPTNGTITKVTFTNTLNITAGLNKGVLSVERKTATVATVATLDLGSTSLTGYTPQSPSLGGGTSFGTGDVYSFKWDAGLVGVALTGFLVTIEYTPSE